MHQYSGICSLTQSSCLREQGLINKTNDDCDNGNVECGMLPRHLPESSLPRTGSVVSIVQRGCVVFRLGLVQALFLSVLGKQFQFFLKLLGQFRKQFTKYWPARNVNSEKLVAKIFLW